MAGLKVPDYDFATDRKEIDELFDPLIKQADEMGAQASKRLAEIKNEMKALDEEKVAPFAAQHAALRTWSGY